MAEPSELEQAINRFRNRLLAGEASALDDLASQYARIERRLLSDLSGLAERISLADDPSLAQLLSQGRINELIDQTRVELERISRGLVRTVTTQQRAALILAQNNALELMGMQVRVRLQTVAAQEMLAAFAPESPVSMLVSNLPRLGQAAVRDALVEGIAIGRNPLKTATMIRAALGGNLARAMTISRTETMRAYRAGTQQTYEANSDLLEGWIWVAAGNACAFCQSKHGTFHPLSEKMASHPRCRCSMAPRAKTVTPLLRTRIIPGDERFAALSTKQQRQILGPAKYKAYSTGAIKLSDLAGERFDPVWGQVGYEKSLSAALGEEQAKEFYAA